MQVTFENVWEPTEAEIRAWAYSGEVAPEPDWDLMLSEVHLAGTLIDLVADPACQPSWKWLLPGATVALALLPGSAPDAVVVAVGLIALVAAIGHIRWALGRSDDSDSTSR